MEQIPKIVTQRLRAIAPASPHPDADLLTAFVEKSLLGDERNRVLEHLAHCADCREAVSLSLPELDNGQTVFKPARSLLRWPVLRWAAVAGCVVVVGAIVADRSLRHEKTASFSALKQTESLALKNEVALNASDARSENDRLAAKLEAPQAGQSKRDLSAAATMGGPKPSPTPMSAAPAAKGAAIAGAFVGMSRTQIRARPSVTAQSVEMAAAPSVPEAGAVAQSVSPAQKDTRADETFSVTVVPGSANETVQVTAAAPLVQTTEVAPGKAKEAKKSLDKELQAQISSNMVVAGSGAAEQLALQGRNYTSATVLTPARWTLSAEGVVQRSLDTGKTWQPITIADHVVFRAISALGPEVWVGGAGGTLYHSSDNGQTWMQVKPMAGDASLTADIATLNFVDVQHGKLTTVDHQTWITSDAGKSWQKQ